MEENIHWGVVTALDVRVIEIELTQNGVNASYVMFYLDMFYLDRWRQFTVFSWGVKLRYLQLLASGSLFSC